MLDGMAEGVVVMCATILFLPPTQGRLGDILSKLIKVKVCV